MLRLKLGVSWWLSPSYIVIECICRLLFLTPHNSESSMCTTLGGGMKIIDIFRFLFFVLSTGTVFVTG